MIIDQMPLNIVEIDWLYQVGSGPLDVGWRTCDFCHESFLQDCWNNLPTRKFYCFIEGGEIICEHCLEHA